MFKKPVFWILVVVILAAAAGGYYYYQHTATTVEASSATPLQTATVKRGNLVLSASGTGAVISESETQLGFENGGLLAHLNVAVGDEVKNGDVLAVSSPSDSAATIQSKLTSARLAVLQAQQNLDDLTSATNTAVSLDQLQSDLATRQVSVYDNQSNLTDLVNERASMNGKRCDSDTIESKLEAYQIALDRWNRSDHLTNSTEYQQMVAALYNYNWCNANYSQEELEAKDAEIASMKATIKLLVSQIAEDQSQIEALSSGTSNTLDQQIAQAKLDDAQASLAVVESESVSNTITAPFDGTIIAISNKVGDDVGTQKFITIADLSQPYLEVLLDESDLNNVGIGYEVSVTFDALPNQTFTGKSVAIYPSLSKAFNVTAIQTTAKLDTSSFSKPQNLPIGLSATVEVISEQANNTLLVPVEALHEISTDSYGVFVMENGTPTFKTVEVGLQDYTYAEIKSGLNEGDVVTTGIVETSK
ncbi:MAG: HlyD family efflux transporter periplasmic adaptor subunit [Anaerolineae bacterium]|nr:HlyD family efflux transporter periplasmic adaptor subunit [Anaerolineae bacterium]